MRFIEDSRRFRRNPERIRKSAVHDCARCQPVDKGDW